MDRSVALGLVIVGSAVAVLGLLVTLGFLWKRRAFWFVLSRRKAVGLYAFVGALWILNAALHGPSGPPVKVILYGVLGLAWFGMAAAVWFRPHLFRLSEG
jgi:hypothetical protein